MTPLAKLWTSVGSYYIPLGVAWAFYVRNGLDKAPPDGVSISRAYWGLLATLIAGSALAATLALYLRMAKQSGEPVLIPPNTSFEERNDRSLVISRATIWIFALSIVVGLAIFGGRYADSRIHAWDCENALADGFVSSRLAAHRETKCTKSPCFAVGPRLEAGKGIDGVNEYLPYWTDGALIVLWLTLAASMYFLGCSLVYPRPEPNNAVARGKTFKPT